MRRVFLFFDCISSILVKTYIGEKENYSFVAKMEFARIFISYQTLEIHYRTEINIYYNFPLHML